MASEATHRQLVACGRRSKAPVDYRPCRRKLSHSHRAALRGMTLLELVLALALSALLLMAISMALQIHWKAIDVRRSNVEEAQLATSILRRVSDDIRSTLKFEPPDLSGLNLASAIPTDVADLVDSVAGGDEGGDNSGGDSAGNGGSNSSGDMPPTSGGGNNQQGSPMQGTSPPAPNQGQGSQPPASGNSGSLTSSGAPSGGSSSETGAGGAAGENSTGGASPTSSSSDGLEADADPAAATGPSMVVGLYGSATELQFEISRLPRVDQYQSPLLSEDGAPAEIPSDIKTVVYFLSSDEVLGDAAGGLAMGSVTPPSITGTGRGLMRAESDRAVSAYGEMNGSTESIYGGATMLAAEVTSLQFQYYDGVEWLPEWNSDEQQGLPLAIEVQFTLDTTGAIAAAETTADPLAASDEQKVFRMVVQLPVGGKFASTATTDAEAMDGSDASANADSADTGASGGTATTGGTGGTGQGAMP